MSTCLPESDNFAYMFFGLVEEVGELAGKISKAIRKGKIGVGEIDGKEGNEIYATCSEKEWNEFEDALRKEAGDVAWMLAGLCKVMDWDLESVCLENLEKLRDRAERGKIDGAGDNR